MKRLIALMLGLATLFGLSASVAAASFWTLAAYTPAPTTNKTFQIEYSVQSTTPTDDFTVDLHPYGSATVLAEQAGVNESGKPSGNSKVFMVTVPSAGTYSYTIVATNNGDSTTKSADVKVTVNDPPAPNTVYVLNGSPSANDTTAAATSETTSSGQIGNSASTQKPVTDSKSVLGSTTQKAKASNTAWYVGVPLVAVVLGGLYYWFVARRVGNK